jgi:uncharacterized repeat protein (TIGR01451 family)
MAYLRQVTIRSLAAFSLLIVNILQVSPVLAQGPTNWQQSATGLGTQQNPDKETAGLGFIVRQQSWPLLFLRGGAADGTTWQHLQSLKGPSRIELGHIEIPGGTSSFAGESVDWAHNQMTFNAGSTQLKLWVSRLSPAMLIQSAASSMSLFTGSVSGNTMNSGVVSSRSAAPSYPKYVAFSSGGSVRVSTLSSSDTLLSSMDQNWILLWYGANSHFIDTKKPLTYPGLPWSQAYQADSPILLVFQTNPTGIKYSSTGGVHLTFGSTAGYVSALPLFGRNTLRASDTETWSAALPVSVRQKAQWWANHLCSFPVTANETYNYNMTADMVSITENVTYVTACSGGVKFAPIPPMLGIAKDAVGVTFSGPVTDADLPTEFGPSLGIENTDQYTWNVSGLKKYTDAKRVINQSGQAPADLEQELVAQVNKITSAGHLAPWIFSDAQPRLDLRGDLYWLNSADILYHLAEIADALPASARANLITYLRSERTAYPPEDVANLPLNQGTIRKNFAKADQQVMDWWASERQDLFLKRVPLYSYYALSRYYDLTHDALPSTLLQKATTVLESDMREQDWATFYWFKGFDSVRGVTAVANRHFAGLVGYVRLARQAQDAQAESLGRALLAKAVVMRVGLAKYPRYLYTAGLTELPSDPAWQPKYLAGEWMGYLQNYTWAGPNDDARQVVYLTQFGVILGDSTAFWTTGIPFTGNDWDTGFCSAHLVAYEDMVPELGRVLKDYAIADALIYARKVEASLPTWYRAFSEATLGAEHNLSHPVDSFQVFMAEALIGNAGADNLATYLDIPWLETGDLFYMQKLAETIKAYRGVAWGGAPEISIAKSSSKLTARYDDTLTFAISIRNTGSPITANLPITLTDPLPVGLSYTGGVCISSYGTAPACSSSSISWKGALAVGSESVSITYTTKITTNMPSAIVNAAHVDAGPYGLSGGSVTILANPHEAYLPIILKGARQ